MAGTEEGYGTKRLCNGSAKRRECIDLVTRIDGGDAGWLGHPSSALTMLDRLRDRLRVKWAPCENAEGAAPRGGPRDPVRPLVRASPVLLNLALFC